MAVNEVVNMGWGWGLGDRSRVLANGKGVPIIKVPTSARDLHIVSAADEAVDFNVANPTHPTLYLHSETTPATDYVSMAHDGNNLVLSVFGGGLSIVVPDGQNALQVNDDALLAIGTDSDARFSWDTTDANANELLLQMPAAGAVNVPVLAIGQSIESVDLGLFNGVVDPTIAIFGIGAVATAPRLRVYKGRGTIAAPTAITTGDDLFGISAYAAVANGEWREAARIEFDSTGTIATTRSPGILRFSTATDAAPAVLTTALTIDAAQLATFAGGITVGGTAINTSGIILFTNNNGAIYPLGGNTGIGFRGGPITTGSGVYSTMLTHANGGTWTIATSDLAGGADITRLSLSGALATAVLTVTQTTTVISAPTAPLSLGTSPGTNANAILDVTGAIGGATSLATTATAGNGGGYTFTGGAGGVATAAVTAATGGNGGAWSNTTGAGGAESVATVTSNGGNGGAATVTTGDGGAVSGAVSGTATGGTSGTLTLATGTGGAVTSTTGTNHGGPSGAVSIRSGAGGAASAATDTGGISGAVTVGSGTGGNGDTGGGSGVLTLITGAAGTGGSPTVGYIAFSPGAAEKWRVDPTGVLTSVAGAPSAVTADGAVIATGGIAMTDVLNALLDDASGGTGTTTLYIGNAAITVASDMRLKENIQNFVGSAIDFLKGAPRLVDFTWNDPTDRNEWGRNSRGKFNGWLAQETIDWAPWVVNAGAGKDCAECRAGLPCRNEGHSFWHVEYDHLVPMMVQGIKELAAEVMGLRGEIAVLKGA